MASIAGDRRTVREEAAASRPLTSFQLLAVCGILFFLTATTSNPLWWNSAIPVVVASVFLLATRAPAEVVQATFGAGQRSLTLATLAMAFATLLAMAFLPNFTTIEATVMRAVIPTLLYFALCGLTLTPRQARLCLISFALGVAVLTIRGTFAFIQEWGVPDFATILWARYDIVRMSSYMSATLGNVGHMGAYLSLCLPPLVYLLLKYPMPTHYRIALAVLVVLGLFNLIMSGSRAGMLTILAAAAVTIARMGFRVGLVLTAFFVLIGLVAVYQASSYSVEQDILTRFLPSEVGTGMDKSVVERFASIQAGWQDFLDNPITGVGPGMSHQVNRYAVPHQSVVMVLSETGLLGGIAFIVWNLLIFMRTAVATLRSTPSGREHWTFLWLIGPTAWLFGGLIAGLTFSMSLALLWIGITTAMLALASARIVPEGRGT